MQLIILILMLPWTCLNEVFPCHSCLHVYLFNFQIVYAYTEYHLGITEVEVQPYDEDEGTGDLRYVQVKNSIKLIAVDA